MERKIKEYTDDELVDIVKNRTSLTDVAFKEIYERYNHKIFSYIKTILIDIEASEDILQDTFTNFYRSLHKDREVSSIERYVIKIARNLCLNYKRSKKNTVNLDEITNVYISNTNYDKNNLMEIINKSLSEMDSKYSDAFIFKKLEGYSFKEIAVKMNITIETAKTRVTRARLKLLEDLAPVIEDLKKHS